MASTFSMFRKRQKAILVFVGVICMIGFVLGPIFLEYVGGQGAQANSVVVSTKYGDLRESDIQAMRQSRIIANEFLFEAKRASNQFVMTNELFGPRDEESVVETHLLAKKAEELGVVVSDRAINDFLKSETNDSLTRDQIESIIQRLRVSSRGLYNALRHELMAQQVAQLFIGGLSGHAPAERWEYYQRLKREAKIEMAEIPVSEFISKVSNPTPAELEEFFEKYKTKLPEPGSPEPGLRVPETAKFQYLVADYAQFVEAAKVTDAEIQAEYDKNKDTLYLAPETPFSDVPSDTVPPGAGSTVPGSPEPDAGDTNSDAGDTNGEAPADEAEPDAATEEAPAEGDVPRDDAESPPADEPSTTEESPSTEPSAESEDSGEEPASTTEETDPVDSDSPAEEPVEEETTTEDSADEQSSLRPPDANVFRLVRFQESDEPATDEAAESAPAGETSSDEEAASEEAPAAEEPAPDSPDADAPAEDPPAEDTAETSPDAPSEETTPEESAEAPDDTAETENAGDSAADGAKAADKPKYKPFSEVQERIRQRLAEAKAPQEMDRVLGELKRTLDRYYREFTTAQANAAVHTGGQKPAMPKPPNFTKLAAKYPGVTAGETAQLSANEIQQTDLGQSTVNQRTPFAAYAYQSLLRYKPAQSQDLSGNGYLFWKSVEQEERVPKLDESGVRKHATAVWKQYQARELARKHAEQLRDQARNSKKPLEAVVDNEDFPVSETGFFSWMVAGQQNIFGQSQPEISQVTGVDSPGNEFMETVFNLEKGQVGVAMNHPQTHAYVARLLDTQPAEQVLRTQFIADRSRSYSTATMEDQRALYRAWIEDLKKEAGIDWKREAQIARGM